MPTCSRCHAVVKVTSRGFPYAHETPEGRACSGVEHKALDDGWCLHCGKKCSVDRKGLIQHHGHCSGNRTKPYPYPPSDDEFTPPEVYEPVLRALGRKSFAFDPASHPEATVPADTRLYFEHDGLSFDWGAEGVGWGQPPYSNPKPWVERFAVHPGGMVCLLNGDYSTSVWDETIWPMALFVILLRGRIRHKSPHREVENSAKRASALVAFDPEGVIEWDPAGLAELEAMGKVVT